MHGAVSLFNVKVGSLVGDVNGWKLSFSSSCNHQLRQDVWKQEVRSVCPSVSRMKRRTVASSSFSPAVGNNGHPSSAIIVFVAELFFTHSLTTISSKMS